MLFGFFGRVSNAPQLKDTLDASTQRIRAIAHRVAGGATEAFPFALPEPPANASRTASLEAEMTTLANEQVRFEASARLLERTYQRIRLGLKES